MPIYEYRCQDCGYRFEIDQSSAARPIEMCPECQGPVRRLWAVGSGFVVRGGAGGLLRASGWKLPVCGKQELCCGREGHCLRD
jgi:putative FmdB family regulatory protein